MIDSECDQSIINVNSFLVQSIAGIHYSVGGALNSIDPSSLELVNEAFTIVTFPDNSKIIFQINQEFLDREPLQIEILLELYQVRALAWRLRTVYTDL